VVILIEIEKENPMRRVLAPGFQPAEAGGEKRKAMKELPLRKASFMACGGRGAPGYWSVGPAFVSKGSEVQVLPGGSRRLLTVSFVCY